MSPCSISSFRLSLQYIKISGSTEFENIGQLGLSLIAVLNLHDDNIYITSHHWVYNSVLMKAHYLTNHSSELQLLFVEIVVLPNIYQLYNCLYQLKSDGWLYVTALPNMKTT